MDSEALAPKEGQAMLAIECFTPLVLALPTVTEPSPGFIQKETHIIPIIRGFDPLILPKPILGVKKISNSNFYFSPVAIFQVLLKVLKETHVPTNITDSSFEGMVSLVLTTNQVHFLMMNCL